MAAPALSESQALLGQASNRLVRDLLDRELTIQQLRAMKEADSQSMEILQRDLAEREQKMESVSGRKGPTKNQTDTALVLYLQKQLTDQDRKIEELTSQLEALKRIDQEMREKIRPIRPPSTIAPPSTAPEPTTP
jgi:bacterioferritin (cytochrome b1)